MRREKGGEQGDGDSGHSHAAVGNSIFASEWGLEMRSHISLGRLFGIRIGIHASWLLIAVLIAFSLGSSFHLSHPAWSYATVAISAVLTALFFFFFLILHELAHSLVARSKGLEVREITLFALGGVSQMTEEAKSAGSEFQIAIVGPLTSAALGMLCLTADHFLGGAQKHGPAGEILSWLGYINFGLAAFNMLPGYPMDGGRVLRAFLWWKSKDLLRATRQAVMVSNGVASAFIVIGIYLFFRGAGIGGLWIAFVGWFLLQAARESILGEDLRRALLGAKVADLMFQQFPMVDQEMSVQRFVTEHLMHSTGKYFVVTHQGEPVGVVTPREVMAIEERMWPFTEVGSVMRSFAAMPSVAPGASIMDALEMLRDEEAGPVPVISGGELYGLLSRSSLMEYVQILLDLQRAHSRGQKHSEAR